MAVGDKNKAKKKPQTEEKAKGLIGLNKGKKVEGAAYSVGNYKGKTLNLSKKQIASSGVKGARKAAAAKATSISDTKYEKGKGVTVGGKAFTGKVDLGGGNMAVYVGGKRVAAKKPAPPRGGGSGGSGGGGGNKSAVQKAKDKMGKAAGYGKGAGTPSNLTGTSGGMGGPARTPRQQSAEYRRQAQAGRRAAGRPSVSATGRPSVSATPKPREGERRTRQVGKQRVVEVYRNGSWLPLTGSRGGY